MNLLNGKYIKRLIGVMLFCIFAMKFCSVLVGSIAAAKQHLSVSKSIDDVKDDGKETGSDDDNKDDRSSEDSDAEKFGKLSIEYDISRFYHHTCQVSIDAETVIPLYIPKAIKEPLLTVPTLPPDAANASQA